MDRTVVIPYKPRDVFLPYHKRNQRWAVLVAHRRCGKTVACVNDLIRKASRCPLPYGRYAYIAPFLSQAKEVAWEYLKRFAKPITSKINEGELWIELLNGARIRVHGADNPDRLRGAFLDGAVLDEYADMRPSVYGEVIRPMLADRQGWATFIGTPKGRNEFFQIYDGAVANSSWFSAMLKASETGILPQDELDDARRDMTPEQYSQEFECSFEAATVCVYFGKEIAIAEREGRITLVEPDLAAPIHTVWDLGIGDSTAIWFWQAVCGEIRIVDHYEASGHGIAHYAGIIRSKLQAPSRDGRDYVPHDAKVRELGTGRTRLEVMEAEGLRPVLVPSHKLMDGINAARLTLPRVWFDRTKCEAGIEALRQYRADFDEKTKAFKDTPRHDWTSHTADAFRYLAMAWREIAKPDKPKEQPVFKSLPELTFDEFMELEAPTSKRERA